MAAKAIEIGLSNLDEPVATHVIGARDRFAEAHPRIDRAELDVLVQNVSDMSQPGSGWSMARRKAGLVDNDPNCLTFARTVFVSSDCPEPVLVQATHPILFRDYLETAFQDKQPDLEYLGKALTPWEVGGRPVLTIASLGKRERGVGNSSLKLAVAKFVYDPESGRVITRVGTRIIPEGRTTQVSHEMPVVDFGRILKQVVDKAAPLPK